MWNHSDDDRSEGDNAEEVADSELIAEQAPLESLDSASHGSPNTAEASETIGEQDILLYPCDFRVGLEFQKSEDIFFSLLKVRIESLDAANTDCFRSLHDDNAVDLTFHIHSVGKEHHLLAFCLRHSKIT